MLICAKSTDAKRVTGLEQKADPGSSARSSRKGHKATTTNCCLSFKSFVSTLLQKVQYQSVGGSTMTALLSALIRILKATRGL